MAGLASDSRMQADQREACQIVFECNARVPGRLVMALRTIRAERPLVRILLSMAAVAGHRELD